MNGKRNSKGKEYYLEGSLLFEAEYSNGERFGKGKGYYEGKLIFEGEYIWMKKEILIKYKNIKNGW